MHTLLIYYVMMSIPAQQQSTFLPKFSMVCLELLLVFA